MKKKQKMKKKKFLAMKFELMTNGIQFRRLTHYATEGWWNEWGLMHTFGSW